MTFESAVAQRFLDCHVPGHRPGSATAAAGSQASAFDSQPLQRFLPAFGVMPSLPEAFAYVTPQPTVQLSQFPTPLTQAVITPPASGILVPLIAQFRAFAVSPSVP